MSLPQIQSPAKRRTTSSQSNQSTSSLIQAGNDSQTRLKEMLKSIATEPPKNMNTMSRKEKQEYQYRVKQIAKNGPRRANVQISELDKTIHDLRRKRTKAIAKLAALQQEQDDLNRRRADVNARKSVAVNHRDSKQERLDVLTKTLQHAQGKMTHISTSTRDKLSHVNSKTAKFNGQRAVKVYLSPSLSLFLLAIYVYVFNFSSVFSLSILYMYVCFYVFLFFFL